LQNLFLKIQKKRQNFDFDRNKNKKMFRQWHKDLLRLQFSAAQRAEHFIRRVIACMFCINEKF